MSLLTVYYVNANSDGHVLTALSIQEEEAKLICGPLDVCTTVFKQGGIRDSPLFAVHVVNGIYTLEWYKRGDEVVASCATPAELYRLVIVTMKNYCIEDQLVSLLNELPKFNSYRLYIRQLLNATRETTSALQETQRNNRREIIQRLTQIFAYADINPSQFQTRVMIH